MTRKLLALIAASLAMTFTALPVAAQEAPEENMVEGAFKLTIDGEVPEDYSFYVETDQAIGGLAPICTTDAEMVASGYTECVGGGAANELPFLVPQGETVQYRVLGSQSVGLSQEVIAEGNTIAETDGFIIEASHAFASEDSDPSKDSSTAEDSGTAEDPGVAGDQYSNEAPAEEIPAEEVTAEKVPAPAASNGEISAVAELHGGVLPNTGGTPIALVAGAALILAAGGFLAHRLTS